MFVKVVQNVMSQKSKIKTNDKKNVYQEYSSKTVQFAYFQICYKCTIVCSLPVSFVGMTRKPSNALQVSTKATQVRGN